MDMRRKADLRDRASGVNQFWDPSLLCDVILYGRSISKRHIIPTVDYLHLNLFGSKSDIFTVLCKQFARTYDAMIPSIRKYITYVCRLKII